MVYWEMVTQADIVVVVRKPGHWLFHCTDYVLSLNLVKQRQRVHIVFLVMTTVIIVSNAQLQMLHGKLISANCVGWLTAWVLLVVLFKIFFVPISDGFPQDKPHFSQSGQRLNITSGDGRFTWMQYFHANTVIMGHLVTVNERCLPSPSSSPWLWS